MSKPNFTEIQDLLMERSELTARLNLLPYQGTPEIKESGTRRYLYIRKRSLGKVTSTYVDKFSEELYSVLLKTTKEARGIQKRMRAIDRELANLGYSESALESHVILNLDYARSMMKSLIYDQAVLEGIGTTYVQTETILENGVVYGVSTEDIQKILNLKHAWEFILDKDVIQAKTDLYLLCHLARLVNENILIHGGRIRNVPVRIGGSRYIPSLPMEADIKDRIEVLAAERGDPIDVAIELCLYVMKQQIFLDGNKRAAVLFANHYLIAKGGGILVIPFEDVSMFKTMLIEYYEGNDPSSIRQYLKDRCYRTAPSTTNERIDTVN